MRKVFPFLKPYKISIIIAYSLTFIELATELLLPFFLGKMINEGVVDKDLNNIIMWGSIMIGLAFVAFISGLVNSMYASHVSMGFAYDIREKLFDKVQTFSVKSLNMYPTSSLVTRFTNDVRQVQNTIHMGLRIMVRAPFLVIGAVMMSFIVNIKLSFIFLITIPLLILFLLWVLKKSSKMFTRVQQKIDGVNQVMQENLAGMRLIKAFLRRDYEGERFKKANEDLATTSKTTFRFVEATTPILLFVMNLALIFIIWFGNIQSIAGETNVGDVITIINYALRITMAISMFSFIIMAFSRMKASSNRLSDILSVDDDQIDFSSVHSNNKINQGKIEFKNVSFNYPNVESPTLDHLSFTVEPQEKLAIMGSTGSGKTTMFQLLPRLYDIEQGSIFIDDKPIMDYNIKELRESIGYVPQNPLLFSGSIIDNLTWGKNNATDKEIEQATMDAQIHDLIMNLPGQYDTNISQRGVNLSGGQKQRVSIARALIRHPKILMLDDSTSALDLATETRLLDAIDKYHCTTLMITQKITTALRADRILLMDDGQLLAIGTHQELIKNSPLYNDIIESQFGKELPNDY